jgi:phosphomethylpyrimidine synthase
MTQCEYARQGRVTAQMEAAAQREAMPAERMRELLAAGRAVIPANPAHRSLRPVAIGKTLSTKINANIGTSCDFQKLEDEFGKLEMVVSCGADAVMDLSTGGDVPAIRRALLERCPLPFGNVPIYEMAVAAIAEGGSFSDWKVERMLETVRAQAEDGVDFMTIHAGLTSHALDRLDFHPRHAGIVSRGGSLLAAWMRRRKCENPFYEHFDALLQIAHDHDVTLSLGDGLRPGSLADASDRAQMEELLTLGELVERCRRAGVQVMVEGPGHLPLTHIEMNMRLQQAVCADAPFYVLGPVVTDVAPGWDHLTSAIGGAIAAASGADFLCYVTPAEHIGLPDQQDVQEGIMAARIAAHVADIAKGVPGAAEWDAHMGEARRRLDWAEQERLSIDPQRFRRIRARRASKTGACSMCGELCVYKLQKEDGGQ